MVVGPSHLREPRAPRTVDYPRFARDGSPFSIGLSEVGHNRKVPRLKYRLAALFLAFVAAGAGPRAAAPLDPPPLLVSRQLSRDARLAVGDTVVLAAGPAGGRTSRFRIVGVYEPTPDPLKFNVTRFEVRLHLPDLMALTNDGDPSSSPDAITALNVELADPADADRFAHDVTLRSPGLVVRQTSRPREGDPFTVLERFHDAIAVVTMVGSTAFLLALMVIRAEERREVVGILRLIGVSRRTIVLEALAEGVALAAAGAVFGVLMAAAAQYGINRFFQARYDTPLLFVRITASIAMRSLIVALPVGVLTGAAAAWTLLRRPPAALVRR
jgi:putative ABC transport system permease protein